jgi:hypothetical protein
MTEETEEQRKNRLRQQGLSNIQALFGQRFSPSASAYSGINGNEFDDRIILKLDKRLKAAFQDVCKENGVTVSSLLRDFMREYVKAYRP